MTARLLSSGPSRGTVLSLALVVSVILSGPVGFAMVATSSANAAHGTVGTQTYSAHDDTTKSHSHNHDTHDHLAQAHSAQNDTMKDDNLTATGYEFQDAELGQNESLRATVTFEHKGADPASAPLTLTIDGEHQQLGVVSVEEGNASVNVDDSAAQSYYIEFECKFEDTDGDGWPELVYCRIIYRSSALTVGDHEVGFNGLEPTRVRVTEDSPRDANLTASGYEIEDREVALGEPMNGSIQFEYSGEGEASAPLTVSIDGERHRLGTVTVRDGSVSLDVEGSAGDGQSISFPGCDVLDRDNDGWPDGIDCDFRFTWGNVAIGDHEVGVNSLEPVAVSVHKQRADLTAASYEFEDRSLAPGEATNATVVFEKEGEGPASAPLTVSINGERHRLGTIEVDGEQITFVENDDVARTFTPIPIPFCDWIDIDGDGSMELVCDIFDILTHSDLVVGDHEVGVNGLEATEITVEEQSANLTVTGYEFEDREVAHGERLNATIEFEKEGEGSASTLLAMSVDGERHRLGVLSVEDDKLDFDDDSPSWIEVEIHCEDKDGDGWVEIPMECEIIIRLTTVAIQAGDHEIGFNGLEPTEITAKEQSGKLEATSYEFEDRSLAPGEATNATVVFEKEGEGAASAPLMMTVDGERHRLATVSIEEGNATIDVNDDAALATIPVLHCFWTDIDGDGALEYVCVIYNPGPLTAHDLAAGDHEIRFNGLEPTRLTVEKPAPDENQFRMGVPIPFPCPDEPGEPGPFNPIPCLPLPLPLPI